jgi:hypothetical protein
VASSDKSTGTGERSPEVLVREIEATREELAVTLDAIADRVSPKRVAKRGSEQAKEAASRAKDVLTEKAGQARVALADRAGTAKESASGTGGTLAERASTAKAVLAEKAALAQASVTEAAAHARTAVAERTGHGTTGAHEAPASVLDADPATGTLPPVAGVEVPRLSPRPLPAASGPSLADRFNALPREAVVGAVAALAALFLLSRRRSG